MGSDESHFNVPLIVRDKVKDSVHRPQLLKRKESRSGIERGPSAYHPNALPLGQTGSLGFSLIRWAFAESAKTLTPDKISERKLGRVEEGGGGRGRGGRGGVGREGNLCKGEGRGKMQSIAHYMVTALDSPNFPFEGE